MNVITNNQDKCDRALKALEQVIDPEIGLNIIDLGLIYQVDFDEALSTLYVSMTLTTRFCPMGESIVNSARIMLGNTFKEHEVILTLTFEPLWNYERISEKGKIFLNK